MNVQIKSSIFLILFAFFVQLFADSDVETRRRELETIRSEIDRNRTEINKLSSKEANLMKLLKTIDNDIALITRYMKKLDDQERALKKDIGFTEVVLTKTSNSLDERKRLLRSRIRSIYKKGRYDELDLIFNSTSISDYLRRNAFFRYITDSDRSLIKGITKQQKKFEETKSQLENHLDDVHSIKIEREKQQASLEKQKAARSLILNQVKGKKSNYLKQVRELEQRQSEINRIIATLESVRKKRSTKPISANYGEFGKLRGKLTWPVKGSIVKQFGTNVHPVYQTKTINNGIDIEVSSGTPVKAAASGSVVYTGVLGSFGNIVIIEHSDGFYTLYANLSRISVSKGSNIKIGSTVGATGNASNGEGAKLHFELRRERQVLDPSDWLE